MADWKGVKPPQIASKSSKDPNAKGKISFANEKLGKAIPWKGAGKIGTATKADHKEVQLGQKNAKDLPLHSKQTYGKG